MSFDKKYPNRKDWRKPYRGSKAIDSTCRSHGSCPWCRNKRVYKHMKRQKPDYLKLDNQLSKEE